MGPKIKSGRDTLVASSGNLRDKAGCQRKENSVNQPSADCAPGSPGRIQQEPDQ